MNTEKTSLTRFILAQKSVYTLALKEITLGRKETHWMWYIFPQLRGFGISKQSHQYGIIDGTEASAYFAHPVLGHRLIECVNAVLLHTNKDISDILGKVDALKFFSCLTLFSWVAPKEPTFTNALNIFYPGKKDYKTIDLIAYASSHALTTKQALGQPA